MNDISPLLMMMMMNNGGGGMSGQQPPQEQKPNPAQVPTNGGALYNMLGGGIGPVMNYPDAPEGSILNIGGASNIPLSKATGWDQFSSYLNSMPATTRLMMGAQGLGGLANVLRGN